MFKERLAAKILLPLFTVFMVFALINVSLFGSMKFLISNPDAIIDMILSDKLIDKLYDELEDEVFSTEIDGFPEDIDMDPEEVYEEIFDKDLVKFLLQETFEAELSGDTKLDEDYLEDWIDDKEDILKDLDFSKSDIKEFKEFFVEQIEDSLEEASENDSIREELEDTFGDFDRIVSINLYVSIAFIVVMLVVLFLVAKNKFAPIRNFGIALIISESISLLAVLGLYGLFSYAAQEAEIEDGFDEIIIGFFNRAALTFGSVFAVLLVVGIILTVVGAILASRFVRKQNEEYEEEYHVGQDRDYEYSSNVESVYNSSESQMYDSYSSDDSDE